MNATKTKTKTQTPEGYALKQLRLMNLMSQVDLARRAGVTRVTISMIESGKTQPTELTLARLGSVLGPLALQSEIAAEMRRRGIDDAAVMAQHASIKAAQVEAVEGDE